MFWNIFGTIFNFSCFLTAGHWEVSIRICASVYRTQNVDQHSRICSRTMDWRVSVKCLEVDARNIMEYVTATNCPTYFLWSSSPIHCRGKKTRKLVKFSPNYGWISRALGMYGVLWIQAECRHFSVIEIQHRRQADYQSGNQQWNSLSITIALGIWTKTNRF